MNTPLIFRGRRISEENISDINTIIKNNPQRNRMFISKEVCQIWNWRQYNGELKFLVCQTLLRQLNKDGYIKLPPGRIKKFNHFRRRFKIEEVLIEETPINAKLRELQPIKLISVRRTENEKIVNYLIHKYHYLGYTRPVGAHLKYIAYDKYNRILAVLIFASAPWYIGVRDKYISWNSEQRTKNLHLICNNVRYLILPWISVEHLASHLLALSRKIVPQDFQKIYNHPIYLMETFVNEDKYKGTCYIADNWIYVGTTTGRGKLSKTKKSILPKKKVFVYPLTKKFRKLLTS